MLKNNHSLLISQQYWLLCGVSFLCCWKWEKSQGKVNCQIKRDARSPPKTILPKSNSIWHWEGYNKHENYNKWWGCRGLAPSCIADENIKWYSCLCMNALSSIIHSNQKVETTQMSINWLMDKQMWYMHARDYYSAIKRNEVLIHATSWTNPENTMLYKRS